MVTIHHRFTIMDRLVKNEQNFVRTNNRNDSIRITIRWYYFSIDSDECTNSRFLSLHVEKL